MRILFIGSQNIKEAINNGGMQCSKRNYELVLEVVGEENLFTGIISNSKEEYPHNQFFKRCANNQESLFSSLMMRRLYKVSEEKKILDYIKKINPDVLFIDTSLFGRIVKKSCKKMKTVVFMHNLEKEYAKHRVKKEGWKYFPAFISTVYNEKEAVKYAHKVICLNSRDAKLVENVYNRKIDFLLPIGFKDTFEPTKVCRNNCSKDLLFIGSNFGPNYDGIKWFINNVMKKLKEYKLIIIGKDFEKAKEELECENVTVVGTVQEIDKYYYKYFNVVLPIKYGDGMKVKTAEAMMFGMNLFATDEALEGYDVQNVKGIFRCNSSEQFIEQIRNSTKEERKEWNEEVRDVYVNNHCFDNQIEIMRKIIFSW